MKIKPIFDGIHTAMKSKYFWRYLFLIGLILMFLAEIDLKYDGFEFHKKSPISIILGQGD